jgi:hypothetical protein
MSFHRHSIGLALTVLTAFLLLMPQAYGDVLFSNLGPGDTFNSHSFFDVYGPTRLLDSMGQPFPDRDIAMPFTPAASDTFGSAELALEMLVTTGPNELDVILLSNAGGVPGAVIESIRLSLPPSSPRIVAANSALHPHLTAGTTYWLAASVDDASQMSWFINSIGDFGSVAFLDSSPGTWVILIKRSSIHLKIIRRSAFKLSRPANSIGHSCYSPMPPVAIPQ